MARIYWDHNFYMLVLDEESNYAGNLKCILREGTFRYAMLRICK